MLNMHRSFVPSASLEGLPMQLSTLTSPAFRAAMAALLQQPLPLRVAFKLKRYVREVEPETLNYVELHQTFTQKYGLRNELGELVVTDGVVKLDPAQEHDWRPELDELLSLESDIEIPRLCLAELGDSVKLSTEHLILLEQIISE